jgi:hypothetical protein
MNIRGGGRVIISFKGIRLALVYFAVFNLICYVIAAPILIPYGERSQFINALFRPVVLGLVKDWVGRPLLHFYVYKIWCMKAYFPYEINELR